MPNVLFVISRVFLISFSRSSGDPGVSAVRKPSAPVLATAAISSALPTRVMPPQVIGTSTSNIFHGLRRQICPTSCAARRAVPAFYRLVDRLQPRLLVGVGRQMVEYLAVQAIADTDLDGFERIEDVELGEHDAVDSAGYDRL